MVLMRLVIRGAGLINMVIMARLLVPEDFGLIAMASIFIGLIDTLSEFSFDVALIKDQQASRKHYDTAWTLSIIRGGLAALLMVLIAGPAAVAIGEPRLEMIIIALASASLLHGFQNIGVVDFRKSLNFRKDFVFLASEKIAAVVVTVGLALIFRNYWALVFGIIAGKAWRLGASYVMHGYRPRFCLEAWRELFAFTKWLLCYNILFFLRNRIDRVVIGKFLGAGTLGFYTIAFDLANLVTSELMVPIRRSLLPGFAKISNEAGQTRAIFIEVFGITLWLGGPIAIGMGLLAAPLVSILFGEIWSDSVPIIHVLVLAGFVALLSSCSYPIFLALNNPSVPTFLCGLHLLLLLPSLTVGTSLYGVIGAAMAVVLCQLIIASIDIVLIVRLLRLPFQRLGSVMWRSLAALGCMAFTVHALSKNWPYGGSWLGEVAQLFIASFGGGSVYIGISLLLWKLFSDGGGPERHFVRQIVQHIPGLSGRVQRLSFLMDQNRSR